MPKYPKSHQDVEYYAPGRKRRVAGSTAATSGFLVAILQAYPTATISRLREIITEKDKYILEPGAVAVLDAYIKAGCGDYVPNWR